MYMRKYLYIGAGGFLGAILRMAIKDININMLNALLPWDTLLINVAGCFLISLFLTVCMEILEIDPDVRLGVVTGFLGAFTTFSSVCKEIITTIEQGHALLAITYLLVSVALGLAAIYFGIIAAREIISKILGDYESDGIDEELE
jgi:CrcB protein